MHRVPIQSTAIKQVGYDPKRHKLEVQYQNGNIYRYLDVPYSVYNALIHSGSAGRYINLCVKRFYRYEKTH